MLTAAEFRSNLEQVHERMNQAAESAGRDPHELVLVGVSKRKAPEEIQIALDHGLSHIGENKVQEARDKFPRLSCREATRHFIGHLQSNKVKYIPELFDVVQSVDSKKLVDRLDDRFRQHGRILPVFLQVNISGEDSKSGVAPEELTELTGYCLEKASLKLEGFMTIGPLTAERGLIRRAFRRMAALVEDQIRQFHGSLSTAALSMGMSADFEIAIQEGASHVRVGTALFGART